MTNALNFLRKVWSFQPEGHFFLAFFDDDHVFRERSFTLERRPRLLNSGVDLYFCFNSFSEANRRNSCAQQGRWLYADLDEVDPRGLKIKPTLAWRTSPGRYQAAWLLDSPLPPDKLAITNQWMTYATGADKGGWSLTKVLRVPWTVSHKREQPHDVRLLWAINKRYAAKSLYERALSSRTLPKHPIESTESSSARALARKHWSALPASAKKLLRTKPEQADGDRSVTLWKLENMLLEAGLSPGDVFVLAKNSAWNKYRGQQREEAQLWNEVMRASARLATDKPDKAAKPRRKKRKSKSSARAQVTKRIESRKKEGKPGILGVPLEKFLAQPHPKPSWLVKDIWTTGSCGVISGEWKGYKSLIALDLALSVATGSPFLDKFPIGNGEPGHIAEPQSVLYLHEEGSPGLIADRLVRIAESKGLVGADIGRAFRNGKEIEFSLKPSNDPRWKARWRSIDEVEIYLPRTAPLHVSTFPGLDLTEPDSIELLHDTIVANNHKLAILESLYLITGDTDENEAKELRPTLLAISEVSRATGCAIAISHHYNKTKDDSRRKLARISGTGVIARWLASGLFLERVGEEHDHTTKLDVIHRELPSMPSQLVKFKWDPDREDDYHVEVMDLHDEDAIDVPAATATASRRKKPSNGNGSQPTPFAVSPEDVLRMVRACGPQGSTLAQLARDYEVDPSALRFTAYELQRDGQVVVTKKAGRLRVVLAQES